MRAWHIALVALWLVAMAPAIRTTVAGLRADLAVADDDAADVTMGPCLSAIPADTCPPHPVYDPAEWGEGGDDEAPPDDPKAAPKAGRPEVQPRVE